MAKRGPKPRRTADPEWTSELAYICGLMASDGCLISDGRHLNLTSTDVPLLRTFKRCLGLKGKITWKPSGTSTRGAWQVHFSDVVLYRWFISIGITPRKSKTIGAIHTPDRYFLDFLRGEFDGDGSSYAYWDTRWHSSISISLRFTSASRQHLTWLNERIRALIGISGCIQMGTRAYDLGFSKTKARLLCQYMYYAKGLPCLEWKKRKLERQLAVDDRAAQGWRPRNLPRGGPVVRVA